MCGAKSIDNNVKKFESLPDKTQNILALLPSMGMGLSNVNDIRIINFSSKFRKSYKIKVRSQWVLVDPSRDTGFLFWKRPLSIVINQNQVDKVKAGKSDFTKEQKKFFDGLRDIKD